MNELVVSRARWTLLPLMRPVSSPEPSDSATAAETATTSSAAAAAASENASPCPPRRAHSMPPSAEYGGSSNSFRNRLRHVRDKIRRRVAQTGDWPPPGAIFGDRYSVSSGIGAMLAANHQFPVPTRGGRGNWTDPALRRSLPAVGKAEAVPMKKRPSSGKGGGSGNKKGAIVCAEMDMNAIIAGFREFEKSVCILKHSSGITETSAKKEEGEAEEKSKEEEAMEEVAEEEEEAVQKKWEEEEEEEEQETNIDSALPKKKKQVSFVDSVRKVPPPAPSISHTPPSSSSSCEAPPPSSAPAEPSSPSTASSLTADLITVVRPVRILESSPKPKRKQSPKEVEYDELGQTWEVYGAEFDAELLGQAIQKRLERMMGGSTSKDEEDEEEEDEDEDGEGTLMKPRTERCERVKRAWRNLWCFSGRKGKYIEASTSALD